MKERSSYGKYREYHKAAILQLTEGQLVSGAGPSVLCSDLIQSLESRGIKTSYGAEHFNYGYWNYNGRKPDEDLVIGIDQGISPEVYHPSLRGRISVVCFVPPFYFTVEQPVSNEVCALYKEELEGNKLIGIFGKKDYMQDFNNQKASYLVWNPDLFDRIIGLHITDHGQLLLEQILDSNGKTASHRPVISVLFGGAPNGRVEEYLVPVLVSLKTYIQRKRRNAEFRVYLGDFVDEKRTKIGRLIRDLSSLDVRIVNERIDRAAYLSSVLNSDIIITKPGSTTISEIVRYCQLSEINPHLIVFQSRGIYPEYFTKRILQSAGFDVIPSALVADVLPDEIDKALTSLKESKLKTKQRAEKLKVTNLVDLILPN